MGSGTFIRAGCEEFMTQFYKHCTLQRGTEGDIAWIPEQFAIEGKYLRIKKDDTDENGWQVVNVGHNRVDGAYLKEHERNYLTQRKASDV